MTKERREFLQHIEAKKKLFKMTRTGAPGIDRPRALRVGESVALKNKRGKVIGLDPTYAEIEWSDGRVTYEYLIQLRI
jgi:hypothetical protein